MASPSADIEHTEGGSGPAILVIHGGGGGWDHLSLDVDWARVDTRSPVLRTALAALTFVKLPFPAVELTSRGEVRGHWLYY